MAIALVRTEGKSFSDGPMLSPERFIELPMLERASKTSVARDAERDLELGDCLYFFAGHACPAFGDLVLAYDAAMADADDGDATPFDTGGLRLGLIYARDLDAGEAKADYCRKLAVKLATWRRNATAYVAEYFGSPADYLTGKAPARDDPSGRLQHPKNTDRRAWTWEVRIWRDHPVAQSLRKAWASPDYYEGVRLALLEASEGASADCARLLSSRTLVKAPEGEPTHQAAEEEMAAWP